MEPHIKKILIIGDLHLRYSLPYESCISDGRKAEWQSVKQKIVDSADDCDAIVQLGDFFNQRHQHSSVNKEAVDFLTSFGNKEIHIISGNHSRYGVSTAIDFLKGIKPNWHIYTEPQLTIVAGIEAFMIPFTTPQLLGVQNKEEGVKKIIEILPRDTKALVFAHLGVTGAILHGVPVDFFNEIVLPKGVMEKHFWHGFYGHYHSKHMLSSSTYICGNVFTNEVGDFEKSIWKYESNGTMDAKVTEISLPSVGIYKIIWEKSDINSIPLHSIIKCYVTSRETNLDDVKKFLSFFDASIIIEQYPNERSKAHFEEGGLDLSIDSLLKIYAGVKKVDYQDLKEGFELIKN